MFKIKKHTNKIIIIFNPQTLQKQNLHKFKIKSKSKTNLVTLRSPKHFNIGKNKIFSLNYRLEYKTQISDINFNIFLNKLQLINLCCCNYSIFLSNSHHKKIKLFTKIKFNIVKKKI